MRKFKMLELPWFDVEEGTRRLREIGMLKWVCFLRPTHSLWEGPEDIFSTKTMISKFFRGARASLKSLVLTPPESQTLLWELWSLNLET